MVQRAKKSLTVVSEVNTIGLCIASIRSAGSKACIEVSRKIKQKAPVVELFRVVAPKHESAGYQIPHSCPGPVVIPGIGKNAGRSGTCRAPDGSSPFIER